VTDCPLRRDVPVVGVASECGRQRRVQ